MSLSVEQIEAAAEDLFAAEATGKQTGLLSLRFAGMTMDDAYAVQDALVRHKLAAGRTIIGWKIGLTSKASVPAAYFMVKPTRSRPESPQPGSLPVVTPQPQNPEPLPASRTARTTIVNSQPP